MKWAGTKGRKRRLCSIGLPLLLLTASCDVVDNRIVCTSEFVYGIVVKVVDAATGAPVAEGLQGVTIQGSTSVPMEGYGNTLMGAGETSGTFAVVVTAPGYAVWTQTDVEVTSDECHVRPVRLDAELHAAALR